MLIRGFHRWAFIASSLGEEGEKFTTKVKKYTKQWRKHSMEWGWPMKLKLLDLLFCQHLCHVIHYSLSFKWFLWMWVVWRNPGPTTFEILTEKMWISCSYFLLSVLAEVPSNLEPQISDGLTFGLKCFWFDQQQQNDLPDIINLDRWSRLGLKTSFKLWSLPDSLDLLKRHTRNANSVLYNKQDSSLCL